MPSFAGAPYWFVLIPLDVVLVFIACCVIYTAPRFPATTTEKCWNKIVKRFEETA